MAPHIGQPNPTAIIGGLPAANVVAPYVAVVVTLYFTVGIVIMYLIAIVITIVIAIAIVITLYLLVFLRWPWHAGPTSPMGSSHRETHILLPDTTPYNGPLKLGTFTERNTT